MAAQVKIDDRKYRVSWRDFGRMFETNTRRVLAGTGTALNVEDM
ncbi:MAG: hypothetical protein ACYTEQ_01650 [Planctomycetota bacterium]|jgi:hypothetical protein